MPVYWTTPVSKPLTDAEIAALHEKFLLAALERIMRSVTGGK